MQTNEKKTEVSMKRKLENLLEKPWAAYTCATCGAVLFYMILSHLGNILAGFGVAFQYVAPVLYGIIIAYLINPVVNFFEKKVFRKIKRENARHSVAVVFGVVLVLLFIGLLIGILIPSLIDSFSGIVANMNTYIETVHQFTITYADVFSKFNLNLASLTASWEKLVEQTVLSLAGNADTIVSTSYSIGTGAVNFLLGLILAIYFLFDKKRLLKGVGRIRGLLSKDKNLKKRDIFWNRCHKILGQYICYDILDGMIVGIVNAIFMLIVGMPYVALVSVIVGVTNLLPTFGPIIGAVIGGILLVLTNPIHALIFLIFTIVLQIFDGYILKPKMFGGSLGVPAVWVLVSIVIGGKMFGIVGILLAIPFAAIFTFVYEENIIPWLQRKKEVREQK